MWFRSGTTWPENGMETGHVAQIRDHMAGKRYGNGTCGAGGRTTWPENVTETGHVVQGKDHMAGKLPTKNPGKEPGLWS